MKDKNKKEKTVGAPTKYKPEYCGQILAFFDRELYSIREKQTFTKDGNPVLMKVEEPCKLPTLERFALDIGVHRDTLHEWAKVHPEFSDALSMAKMAQQEIVTQHGLTGKYERTFAIFMATNLTDLKSKTEVTQTYEVNDELLNELEDALQKLKAVREK